MSLWLPATEPDHAGMMETSAKRAENAGLRPRELSDTVRDTAAWLAGRENAKAWQHVLSDARERQLVSSIGMAHPPAES